MRKKITVIGNHYAFDEINGFTKALGLYAELSKKYDINIIVPRGIDIYPDETKPFGRNMTLRFIAADDSFLGSDISFENFHRLAENPTLQKKLREAGSDADLIICEGPFYVSFAKLLFPEKTVTFRSLHLEYEQMLWRKQYTDDTVLQAHIDGAFNLEKQACEDADWIFALTDYDADRMCELYGIQREKIKIVPLCFPDAHLSGNYLPRRRGCRKALYMSACPIDSAERFVSMMNNLPQIEFHIVGKAGWALQGYGSNVIFHGVVSEDELQRIEADCDFALNLTHMMTGVSSKIVDYFSSGIPTICNDIGVRGFHARRGEHYFPAEFDTLESDIRAFLGLSDDERYQIVANAFHHICSTFDYAKYTPFIDVLISGNEREDEKLSYYIFGAGMYGRTAFYELKKIGKSCIAFVDNNSKRWGELYCGVKIVSPTEAFCELNTNKNTCLMIAVSTEYLGAILRQAVPEIGKKQISVYGHGEIDLDKALLH